MTTETMEDCKYYENCEAQLCPLDELIDNNVWYPDEDVCCSGKFKHLGWVKRQKSLRRHKGTSEQGYFTKKMLEQLGRITTKTKGLNSDKKKTADAWVAQKIHKKAGKLKLYA